MMEVTAKRNHPKVPDSVPLEPQVRTMINHGSVLMPLFPCLFLTFCSRFARSLFCSFAYSPGDRPTADQIATVLKKWVSRGEPRGSDLFAGDAKGGLGDMYKTPDAQTFKGAFEEARAEAESQGKLLMVNIQV